MAQALGYVTETQDGNFEGHLAMGLNAKIKIVNNGAKDADNQPDYRVFTARSGEIGAGWTKVGKVSGREYISLTLASPLIGPRRVYANLGRHANGEDGEYAILWNPED